MKSFRDILERFGKVCENSEEIYGRFLKNLQETSENLCATL